MIFASLLALVVTSSCKTEKDSYPYKEIYFTLIGGTVTAEDSTPVSNILVQSSIERVFTDINGYYEINVTTEDNNIYLNFSDFDGEANGGQFCSENLDISDPIQKNNFDNNVVLQKMVKIHIGGIVTSVIDNNPIKKIFVESEIDRTLTDENGYYEIWTGAKPGENAHIIFTDHDYKQNGGAFLEQDLYLPLEKDNTFDNNVILESKYAY